MLFTASYNISHIRLAIIIHTTVVVSNCYENFVIVNDFQRGNGQGDDNEYHNL